MSFDGAPTQGHPVSPATWGALGALVLLLGAIAVLLVGCFTKPQRPERGGLPNHYTCECECTKGLSVGARIRTVQTIAVRPDPSVPSITLVAAGIEGTIIGERDIVVGGSTVKWWQINFNSGVTGWTNAPYPTFFIVLSSDTSL